MSTPEAAGDVPLPDLGAVSEALSGLMTAKQFREAAQAGTIPENASVARDFDAEITKADGDGPGRRFDFRLTTGREDRDNDRIRMDGWSTEDFEKNPIWLWAHDTRGTGFHTALTGLVVEREMTKSAIDVGVEYVPAHVNPLAESVFQMHEWRRKTKALKDRGGAASVGALPLKWKFVPARGGIDFLEQEWLEGSDVMIGSNRDALGRMKAAGVDLGPVGEWAEAYRKSVGLITLDAARAEAIAQALDPAKGLEVFELDAQALAKLRQPATLETTGEDPRLERLVAGLKLLTPTIRAAVAPIVAAVGCEGAEALMPSETEASQIKTQPEAPAAKAVEEPAEDKKTAEAPPAPKAEESTEPASTPDAEKAAPTEVELDDEAIERIARRYADDALITLTGSPLREDN